MGFWGMDVTMYHDFMFITVTSIMFLLSIVTTILSWLMRQLWYTKPNFNEMNTELNKRFTQFALEDLERDKLLLSSIETKLDNLKEIRGEDHVVLMNIQALLQRRVGIGE